MNEETFDTKASLEDICACFRLLLGRAPGEAELAAHAINVGADLGGLVRNFLGSREFRDRFGSDAEPLLVEMDGYALYADPADAAVGAHVAARRYEPGVAALLRRILRPGMTMLDLGANIGTLSMLAASVVGPTGFVLAVEPSVANIRLLEASRRRNGFSQLAILLCAAGRERGLLELRRAHSNGATNALGGDPAEWHAAEIVPALPLPALWPSGRRLDVVKADIEGAEFAVFDAARDFLRAAQPLVISEFSPAMLAANSGVSGADYLRLFAGLGYRAAIVEGDRCTTPASPEAILSHPGVAGDGHIDLLFTPARSWRTRFGTIRFKNGSR